MARSIDAALGWAEHGAKLVHEALTGLDETAFDAPSGLPGWTRRHVAAHLAANADAVGNLVHWAATGERTPMYSSPEQRTADIAKGSTRTGADLRHWFDASAARLSQAMSALTPEQWSTEVVTAQGRTVPASETPWMRAREVMVHAVDLRTGTTFADLPSDFLEALVDDVLVKRGDVPEFHAPLDQRAAWLTGRPHDLTDAPILPPWL
jgi:maleylpyruvate isomerase